MFFVYADPNPEIPPAERLQEIPLVKLKIDESQTALVAFATRELGEKYLDHLGPDHGYVLRSESQLEKEALALLAGEPLFLIEDELMIQEIQRRGTGFPFCEFVREYDPPE